MSITGGGSSSSTHHCCFFFSIVLLLLWDLEFRVQTRRLELRRCWLSHSLSTLAFLTFVSTFDR